MILRINDLKRHTDSLGEEIRQVVLRVLQSGYFMLGPELEAFEQEFALFCGVSDAVGVGNGTDALEIALRGAGIGPSDQVAVTANAGMYATTAILATGAEPLYIDVDEQTLQMNPEHLRSRITPNTRAVIVTHLYGRMADMPALLKIAESAGMAVIEDCAQAHGACLDGKAAGSFGLAGCFSFYPTKNLGACGDAGAVVSSSKSFTNRVRMLRQYGWRDKYRPEIAGGRNSRLDEIQAAILRLKLTRLKDWNLRRREIAGDYDKAFSGMRDLLLMPAAGENDVRHLYVIRTARRDELLQHLEAAGIKAEIHYPVPDHLQKILRGYSFVKCSLPVTEKAAREVMSLPCFPELTGEEVKRVCKAVTRNIKA